VVLQEDAMLLEDAVVVGFGTQRRENLTGAVSAVNVSQALESRPIADVGRGLQGMTPGLTVRVGSTEVGFRSFVPHPWPRRLIPWWLLSSHPSG